MLVTLLPLAEFRYAVQDSYSATESVSRRFQQQENNSLEEKCTKHVLCVYPRIVKKENNVLIEKMLS